jgi:putative ABC transport system permease protein
MILGENFRVAFQALRANKMRSILTTLGIIIGVAAVVAVVSIVQGLQFMITKELQGVGATYVMVFPDRQDGGPGVVARQTRLTWDDGQAIKRQVPGVKLITPVIVGRGLQVKYRDRQHASTLIAVNAEWPDINNHAVETGRFISNLDLEHRRKVAVIGQKVVDELRLGDPIGKEVTIGNLSATVIGVMEKRGQALGEDSDDLVFIPFDTGLALFGASAGEQVQLRLQAETAEVVGQVKDGITRLLRARHKIAEGQPADFQVLLQDELLSSISSILGMVTTVVGAVVGVALLVGGIGIMNIMLVSVTERTREIGVRKAVGARRQDILVQFLIEAITLSLLGGLLGVGIGYGLGVLATSLLPGDWPPAHVPVWAVTLAFGFCALVGVSFGIYPAGKAAKLDPIEALRYE